MSGCTLQSTQWELNDRPLSCDEASRISYRTLEAMRFRVDAFEPAAPGKRGTIDASRVESGASGRTQSVTTTIDCTPAGVTIEIHQNGILVQQLDLKRAFYQAFLNVQAMRSAQGELDAQMLTGTAPASQQRRDLKVLVTPLRGQAAKLDFPFDFAAAGILPVRVEITNLTPLTYVLDVDEIRLARADRERIAPLTPAAAAASLAAKATQSAAAIADQLATRQLTSTSLAPGVQRQGYLYFPLADYRSARVVLTDKASGEDEGVRVEF
ncbi:MAG: hypothetical protein ABI629_19280 [bacterium]